MRIDCPSCNAAYDVPSERLAAGRVVKCARCGGAWTPVPADVAPAPAAPLVEQVGPVGNDAIVNGAIGNGAGAPVEVPAAGPPLPERLVQKNGARRRSGIPIVAAWLLSIAALATAGWVAVDRRAEIMAAWPPSIRAYAAVGLAPPH